MAWPPMDPMYEQCLKEEVLYLHSLWHQGPPRASSAAAAAPPPPFGSYPHFKLNRNPKQKGKRSQNQPSNSSSGIEWAVPPPAPSPTDAWPIPGAEPDRQPRKLSPEEQLHLAATHLHRRVFKVVAEHFRYNKEGDDSDSISSGSDGDEGSIDENGVREEHSFFFKVFEENTELREYYEKNFARGEFGCLVCGGLGGKKTWKMYKGCLPLVQHSITIAKTKKRKAHRAFGQAACKILNWDINDISNIVSLLALDTGSGENMENLMEVLDNAVSVQGDIVEEKKEETVQESGPTGIGILPNGVEGDVGTGSGDVKETLLPSVTDDVLTVEADILSGKNDEPTPKSGAIGDEDLPNNDGMIGSGDDKESPSPSTENGLTAEGGTVEGKNESFVPENSAIVLGNLSAGDGGDEVPLNENAGVGVEMRNMQIDNEACLDRPNKDGAV